MINNTLYQLYCCKKNDNIYITTYRIGEIMTKYDKILILFIVVLSLVSIYFTKYFAVDSMNKSVYIEVNGDKYKELLIDESTNETFEVISEYGSNKIDITDGKVRVIEASCPDKLDVRQGAISKPGEIIVCLPNKMSIEILGKSDNGEDDIDYLSH